jgi:hypothetical protein
MERIYLAKEEKEVFLHVAKYGKKQPRNITPVTFHYCLSTLEEKGLVEFRINYDEVLDAEVTDKGNVYLEQNPKLKNPVDWKWIILTILTSITAISTLLALFKD